MALEGLLYNHNSNKTKPQDSIEFRSIESLGFIRGKLVISRRSEPTPQLECLSSPIDCQNTDIDYVLCHNLALLTESSLVFWDCKAKVPEHYEIYFTKVDCEGYNYPGDSYILKGSCNLKYQVRSTLHQGEFKRPYKVRDQWAKYGFILIWISVAFFLLYKLFRSFIARPNHSNNSSAPRPNSGDDTSSLRVANNDPPLSVVVANQLQLRQRGYHSETKQVHESEERSLSSQQSNNESGILYETEDGYLELAESNFTRTRTTTRHTNYLSSLESRDPFNRASYLSSPLLERPQSRVFLKRTQSFITTASSR